MMTLVFVFAGSGCGTKSTDEAFIIDLKKGLCTRWDAEQMANEDAQTYYERLVDYEWTQLSKYIDAEFENAGLQKAAAEYIALLQQQKEALPYYSVNQTKFLQLWQEAYNLRAVAITTFIREYGLVFSDEYNDTVNKVRVVGEEYLANLAIETAIDGMIADMHFKVAETTKYSTTYETYVKNTTGHDLAKIWFKINLLDKNGVIIDDTTIYIENIKAGQTAKAEFSTDIDFADYEITAQYYMN